MGIDGCRDHFFSARLRSKAFSNLLT